jgi:hypothetical protein
MRLCKQKIMPISDMIPRICISAIKKKQKTIVGRRPPRRALWMRGECRCDLVDPACVALATTVVGGSGDVWIHAGDDSISARYLTMYLVLRLLEYRKNNFRRHSKKVLCLMSAKPV